MSAQKFMGERYPVTPDGRYFVVRARLWRMSDPQLPEHERERLTRDLMAARRAVGQAKKSGDRTAESAAHDAVHRAKVGLGERGPVWWCDDEPDLNRHMARTGPYRAWFEALTTEQSGGGKP